jgi:hypothetical protein
MIGADTIPGIAPTTSPSMVLSAIDMPNARSGRVTGVHLDDGSWSLGHREGGMIRMPGEAAAWVAACLAMVTDLPGRQESFRRGVMWALYNPADKIFNLVAGTACVCVEGYDNIRVIARWMEEAGK